MTQTLYKIETDYLDLINKIQDQEGELTDEQAEMLVINQHQLESKSLAYQEVISQKTAFVGRIDEEIKRLQAIKKREEKTVERLKDSLLTAVFIFGEFKSGLFSFGTRKSSSVEVDDVNALPQEFKVVKVTEQADKIKIKEALQSGQEIEGCRIIENHSLKIK
jgi:hypothetical protein